MDLIQAINGALEYAIDRESFIENMEVEGYQVIWTDNTRKHVTFICPDGRRCRDSSLHDETFPKENLEALFAYRQAVGFYPGSVEPDEGWLGEVASGLLRLGKEVEQQADLLPLPAPPAWTDSKQYNGPRNPEHHWEKDREHGRINKSNERGKAPWHEQRTARSSRQNWSWRY